MIQNFIQGKKDSHLRENRAKFIQTYPVSTKFSTNTRRTSGEHGITVQKHDFLQNDILSKISKHFNYERSTV